MTIETVALLLMQQPFRVVYDFAEIKMLRTCFQGQNTFW